MEELTMALREAEAAAERGEGAAAEVRRLEQESEALQRERDQWLVSTHPLPPALPPSSSTWQAAAAGGRSCVCRGGPSL